MSYDEGTKHKVFGMFPGEIPPYLHHFAFVNSWFYTSLDLWCK